MASGDRVLVKMYFYITFAAVYLSCGPAGENAGVGHRQTDHSI